MGLKDLFTARKQDSSCCGAQIVPDDDDQPQSEQGTPTETAASSAPNSEDTDEQLDQDQPEGLYRMNHRAAPSVDA